VIVAETVTRTPILVALLPEPPPLPVTETLPPPEVIWELLLAWIRERDGAPLAP